MTWGSVVDDEMGSVTQSATETSLAGHHARFALSKTMWYWPRSTAQLRACLSIGHRDSALMLVDMRHDHGDIYHHILIHNPG